ncbi:MAG: globin [Actinobacteria bacterium]|nr:globin [Actinomycetota bacterium]MCG2801307.1 globin [Cellulomonas sp.]
MSTQTLYDAVGGHETFARLVGRFYEQVADDTLLRPMYPDDLAGACDRMTWFLEQFWGGPTTYSDRRGHPALRMRHAAFRLDSQARDRWLALMRISLDELALAPEHAAQLWEHLERTANFLRNTADPTVPGTVAVQTLTDRAAGRA